VPLRAGRPHAGYVDRDGPPTVTARYHRHVQGGAGTMRVTNWRTLLAVATAAALVSTVSLVWVARQGEAQVAPEIELSNSCAVWTIPPTTTQLTIWGSHVPQGPHTISDAVGFLHGVPGVVTPDALGNFTVTGSYTPTDTVQDTVLLDASAPAPLATRPLIVVVPFPGCPKTAPPATPCWPPGQAVPVSVSGMVTLNRDPVAGGTATWFLDYPGAGHNPLPFASSPIDTNDRTSALLPGSLATSGLHNITAISQPPPGFAPAPAADFVYTTFPITVCPPTKTTTTTQPGTTTSTTAPTTTATTNPTTTTTGSTTTTTTTPPAGPTPALTLSPGVGPTGGVVMVNGSNFPINTPVVVQWGPAADSPGNSPIPNSVSVNTGPLGQFSTQLLVLPHDKLGNRQAVAVGFPSAVAPMLVVPSPVEPGGSSLVILYHN
jgi:hypothetical protein